MQSITSLFLSIAGIAVLAFFGFVTLSLMMVFAGILSLTLVARAVMGQPKPVPVHARRESRKGQDVRRVWNDGQGTIIDM